MNKYLTVFKISFAQEFAYKANFVMWRVRNVFTILLTYFLWSTVFADSSTGLFGYNRTEILTYVFGIMIVRAMVLSARAMDVAGDIANGDLSNYLLKPFSYFKYWLTRDVSSKVLNLMFAVAEFAILFLILKPDFLLQTNIAILISFFIVIVLAMLIYFLMLFLISTIPFWAPELAWGSHFLITVVIVESLSGSLFPINILPEYLYKAVMFLPFPYLIYFPVQVYLGNISGQEFALGISVASFWVMLLALTLKYVWQKGLKVYESVGR